MVNGRLEMEIEVYLGIRYAAWKQTTRIGLTPAGRTGGFTETEKVTKTTSLLR
jgi:hypothetical protein